MINHTLICLTEVYVSSRKKWSINLNNYRNSHFQVLNKAKKAFSDEMYSQIKLLPIMEVIEITYELFRKNERRCDIRNICTIVDKFLMDAIVKMGKLPDDDYKHDLKAVFVFGGVDPKRPRVEATIRGIK